MIDRNTLHNADCFDIIPLIADTSVDLILCDLPYGTTACRWDTPLDLPRLWKEYERVIKPNGAIVLFGSQPFTTSLISSKPELFKYVWYWIKNKQNGFQQARNRPMTKAEDIAVFSKAPTGHASLLGERRMKYFPQGVIEEGEKTITRAYQGAIYGERPKQVGRTYTPMKGVPSNVLHFDVPKDRERFHPTEKPVDLLAYLVKSYTNEGELVLDNTMGVGSTCVAALRTGRDYIGIEKEYNYFDIACKRLEQESRKAA